MFRELIRIGDKLYLESQFGREPRIPLDTPTYARVHDKTTMYYNVSNENRLRSTHRSDTANRWVSHGHLVRQGFEVELILESGDKVDFNTFIPEEMDYIDKLYPKDPVVIQVEGVSDAIHNSFKWITKISHPRKRPILLPIQEFLAL